MYVIFIVLSSFLFAKEIPRRKKGQMKKKGEAEAKSGIYYCSSFNQSSYLVTSIVDCMSGDEETCIFRVRIANTFMNFIQNKQIELSPIE